jgi:hypothetical protein
MNNKLLNEMVDYIDLTDNVISELKDQPKFSDEALEKAAFALAEASMIKKEEQEELVELFRTDPDKALESITKVAANLPKAPKDYSLGGPGEGSSRSRFSRESDRVLYEKLGLT